MIKILVVNRDEKNFGDLISALKGNGDIELELSDSGEKALAEVADKAIDLVVTDEDLGDMTGLELVKGILKINCMINFAVVSGLSAGDFHEASEGLGVMTQLPKRPDKNDADDMIKTLRRIKGM
ncbi:MAG: response regulator [Deltaproteobacteria bacterium]|nr:response regulator [Deltaproteobacteria bacterium]